MIMWVNLERLMADLSVDPEQALVDPQNVVCVSRKEATPCCIRNKASRDWRRVITRGLLKGAGYLVVSKPGYNQLNGDA